MFTSVHLSFFFSFLPSFFLYLFFIEFGKNTFFLKNYVCKHPVTSLTFNENIYFLKKKKKKKCNRLMSNVIVKSDFSECLKSFLLAIIFHSSLLRAHEYSCVDGYVFDLQVVMNIHDLAIATSHEFDEA